MSSLAGFTILMVYSLLYWINNNKGPRARLASRVSLDNPRNLSQQKLNQLTSCLSYMNYFTCDSNNSLMKGNALAEKEYMNH